MAFALSWLDPDLPFDAATLHTFRDINGLHAFEVDLAKRPVTKDVGPGRISAVVTLLVTSLFFGLLSIKVLSEGEWHLLATIILLLIAAFAFFVFVRPAVATLRRRRIATFERLDVRVVEPDGRSWRCGYRHFLGVQQKELTLRSQGRNVTFAYVELVHEDPKKTLLLYATTRENVEGDPGARYADALDLPILGRDGVGDT